MFSSQLDLFVVKLNANCFFYLLSKGKIKKQETKLKNRKKTRLPFQN